METQHHREARFLYQPTASTVQIAVTAPATEIIASAAIGLGCCYFMFTLQHEVDAQQEQELQELMPLEASVSGIAASSRETKSAG